MDSEVFIAVIQEGQAKLPPSETEFLRSRAARTP